MISLKKFCEVSLRKPVVDLKELEKLREKEAATFHQVVYELDTAEQLQAIGLTQLVHLAEDFNFHMGEEPAYVSTRKNFMMAAGKRPSIRRKRLI